MINSNKTPSETINFSAKPNLNTVLPKARDTFKQVIPSFVSPSRMTENTDFSRYNPIFCALETDLYQIRTKLQKLQEQNKTSEYFTELISLVRAMAVANCSECAEISKTILRANGVKNSDIFLLMAKSKDGKVRSIDHAITAIGVKKRQNNKHSLQPFTPDKNVRVMDMWLDTKPKFIGKISKAQKKYAKIFNLKPEETILLKPINTLEPDNTTLAYLRSYFPNIVIK